MTRYGLLLILPVVSALGVASGAPAAKDDKVGEKTRRAGSSFKDCNNCPEMIVIPAGSFMMGSPAAEQGRRDNEPQSRVTIARSFAVSKTEVAWDQWEACVLELKGLAPATVRSRVQDPGSYRLQLDVRDIDAALAGLTSADSTVVSTGRAPVSMTFDARPWRLAIAPDPNNLFLVVQQGPPPAVSTPAGAAR